MRPFPRRARCGTAAPAIIALAVLCAATPASPQVAPLAPLTLGDAARLAARRSAAAAVARHRAEQADARVVQRRADLLPQLSAFALESQRTFNTATLGFTFPGIDPEGQVQGPVHTLEVRGRVAQTVFDWSAIARLRSARATAGAFEAEAASVAEQAGAAAAAAYIRVLRSDAEIAARSADSALAQDLVRIARDQRRAGVGVALDVTRAEAQVAGIQAQLVGARGSRDRAWLDLLRALGLPLEAELSLADSLTARDLAELQPNESEAVERALRTRSDLRAEDERLRAAERAVAAVRAERLPSLSAFAEAGAVGGPSVENSYSNLLGTYAWGVQLSVPIFDGLRREARVEEQLALAREIDVRRQGLRQQAAIDVRGAILDLATARLQVAAARERLRLAEQELSQARERFRTGVAGSADVVTAALALNASRNLLTDALTGYQAARVEVARAEGTVTMLP